MFLESIILNAPRGFLGEFKKCYRHEIILSPKNSALRVEKTKKFFLGLDKLGYSTSNLLPEALSWTKVKVSFGVYSIHDKELKKLVLDDMRDKLNPTDIERYGKMFMHAKLGLGMV